MQFYHGLLLVRLPVETDRERDFHHQLKQANDTATRLRDELRQAADRETRLQVQLDKMKMETKYRPSKMAGLSIVALLFCVTSPLSVTMMYSHK